MKPVGRNLHRSKKHLPNSSDSYQTALRDAQGKNPDYKVILEHLKIAVSEGNAQAADALGRLYYYGNQAAVPQNLRTAIKWFRCAVKLGGAEAAYSLGRCYELGEGVTKNERSAFKHYLFGAVRSDADCMEEVGRCLYWGIGTAKDKASSRIWLDATDELRQDPTRAAD
jgi:TPR repeat protein